MLAEIKERETGATVGIGIGLDKFINYQTPVWSNSVHTEEFVRIAARNGDTGFDGIFWSFIYLSRVVLADKGGINSRPARGSFMNCRMFYLFL